MSILTTFQTNKTYTLTIQTLKKILTKTNLKFKIQLNIIQNNKIYNNKTYYNYFFSNTYNKKSNSITLLNIPSTPTLHPPFNYSPYHNPNNKTYNLFLNSYSNNFKLKIKFI